ncbi:MAG: hypothetical protein AAGI66_07585 [Cyanobacteria bacterium P01_H01_bin.74]
MSQLSRLRDAEITNGNIINADDIDTEFNQLLSESNAQDTRLNALETQSMTIGGTKTFSGAVKANTITEDTTDSGVSVESVIHKDGAIQLAETEDYAPTATGQLGYDSTSHQFLVMENGIVRKVNTTPYVLASQSASYMVQAADKGKVLTGSTALTMTMPAAETLGENWHIAVKNTGTALITVLPDGDELIDGQNSLTICPQGSATLLCDGSGFLTLDNPKAGTQQVKAMMVMNAASIHFDDVFTASYPSYLLRVVGLIPETNDVNCYARISTADGIQSGSTDYQYSCRTLVTSSNVIQASNNSSEAILNYNAGSARVSNTPGAAFNLDIVIDRPASTALKTLCRFNGSYTRPDGFHNYMDGYFAYQAIQGGVTNAVTGIEISLSTGNIASAMATLYGLCGR